MPVLALLLSFGLGCTRPPEEGLQPFPAGYIDSAYVVPDGSAIYFIHSVVSTLDILQQNQSARPVTTHLPGHQAQAGGYWWNTDIYVSASNPDGTWGAPRNLGPTINSEHMESSPWTNIEQTVLIFTRESVTEPALSGTFISRRNSRDEPWGMPERLPGELGMYGATGFMDFHLVPSGNLYFWSETLIGNGALYWAKSIGPNQWSAAELMPDGLQSDLHETQPWVNDDETVIYFNRRGDDANTRLMRATRADASMEWGIPTVVQLRGFADPNNYTVWGEPSFVSDGTMFFVRFDTSTPKWRAEILLAVRQDDESYGPPQELIFRYRDG